MSLWQAVQEVCDTIRTARGIVCDNVGRKPGSWMNPVEISDFSVAGAREYVVQCTGPETNLLTDTPCTAAWVPASRSMYALRV